MKYCTNCGKPVNESADVCLSCGKLLKKQNNKSFKKEKKSGFLWIFSLVAGIISFVTCILMFVNIGFLFFAFLSSVIAVIVGILGFSQKSRLNLIGLIMGIIVVLNLFFLFIFGIILTLFEPELYGTWEFDNNTLFEITESGDRCIWYDDENYYQGICSYYKANDSFQNISDADDNTFIMNMDVEEVNYDGVIFNADDFLGMKSPRLQFYIYLNEDGTEAHFTIPSANLEYDAYK